MHVASKPAADSTQLSAEVVWPLLMQEVSRLLLNINVYQPPIAAYDEAWSLVSAAQLRALLPLEWLLLRLQDVPDAFVLPPVIVRRLQQQERLSMAARTR